MVDPDRSGFAVLSACMVGGVDDVEEFEVGEEVADAAVG